MTSTQADVRAAVAEQLPSGVTPMIVVLGSLPRGTSGKVDRKALPWPPPARLAAPRTAPLSETAAWLAERWVEQLGPLALDGDSNFFELGGSSLAAAKLVSELRSGSRRSRSPTSTTTGGLESSPARLDGLGEAKAEQVPEQRTRHRPLGRGADRRSVLSALSHGAPVAARHHRV